MEIEEVIELFKDAGEFGVFAVGGCELVVVAATAGVCFFLLDLCVGVAGEDWAVDEYRVGLGFERDEVAEVFGHGLLLELFGELLGGFDSAFELFAWLVFFHVVATAEYAVALFGWPGVVCLEHFGVPELPAGGLPFELVPSLPLPFRRVRCVLRVRAPFRPPRLALARSLRSQSILRHRRRSSVGGWGGRSRRW